MPNVANLIKVILKSSIIINNILSSLNVTMNKAACPLKGKCQYEYIVDKGEMHSGPNNNNNGKKCTWVQPREVSIKI